MENSVDPDQLASWKPTDLDLHCLQRQCISGFSRTSVNVAFKNPTVSGCGRKSNGHFLSAASMKYHTIQMT